MTMPDVLLALLSIFFGLWAGVVYWAAQRIVGLVDGATKELRQVDRHLTDFITATEARLAVIESQLDAARNQR